MVETSYRKALVKKLVEILKSQMGVEYTTRGTILNFDNMQNVSS